MKLNIGGLKKKRRVEIIKYSRGAQYRFCWRFKRSKSV